MTLLTATAGLTKIAAGALASLLTLTAALPARDEIRAQQWHLEFLNIDQAHAISTGEGVIVGIIDTGVDGGHPDLAGSLLPGADFSFLNNPDALEDLDGHGTAMAGLIAAHGQAVGIAPDATILPVRRSSDMEVGSSSTSAAAIDWAIDNGATVLCLAFAGNDPSVLLEQAIQRAAANDVVVIAGVGNTPDHQGLQYPTAYPGVVGAAGIDRNGDHASVSVVSGAADLAAPAVEITSTESRAAFPAGYGARTGTSTATAIIAGVAALIRSEYPELSAEDVIHRMTATADDRGAPGRDDEYGYGIVNPVAALTADVPPINPPPSTPAANATPTSGSASPPSINLTPLLFAAIAGAGVVVIVVTGLVLTLRRRP